MIVKCPKCAENLEIETALLNQWGVCPCCQSYILFSNERQTFSLHSFDIESGRLAKIGLIIAVIGLLGAIICGMLADFFEGRADSYYQSPGKTKSYRNGNDDFDIDKERTRAYIETLPEGQRRAFYGGNCNSADKMNLLTNILESDNLDGAIKLLEN